MSAHYVRPLDFSHYHLCPASLGWEFENTFLSEHPIMTIDYDDIESVRCAARQYADNPIVMQQIIENLMQDKIRLIAAMRDARSSLETQGQMMNPSLMVVRQVAMKLARCC